MSKKMIARIVCIGLVIVMCFALSACGNKAEAERYAELVKKYIETNYSASLADDYTYYVSVNSKPKDYIYDDTDGYTNIIARVCFGDKIAFFIEDGALESYKNGGSYQKKISAFAPMDKESFINYLITINPAVANSKGVQDTMWKEQEAMNNYYLPSKSELNKWVSIEF